MVKYYRREQVVAKEVIDSGAKKIGVVKDLAYSRDGKMALVVERNDGKEAFLSFDKTEKIADVVIIKSAEALDNIPMKVCSGCESRNPAEAKFCFKCGKKMPKE
mgnify:CR=1 FL=1